VEFRECTTNIIRHCTAMTNKRQPAICGHHTAITTKSLAWNTWSSHSNEYKNTSLRHVVTTHWWLQNHYPKTRSHHTAMTNKNRSLRHMVTTQRWLTKTLAWHTWSPHSN